MREHANAPLQLGLKPSTSRPPLGRTAASRATNRAVQSFMDQHLTHDPAASLRFSICFARECEVPLLLWKIREQNYTGRTCIRGRSARNAAAFAFFYAYEVKQKERSKRYPAGVTVRYHKLGVETMLKSIHGPTLALVALLALPAISYAAQGRWALVVGNDSYARVAPLVNAAADAKLIATELTQSGFDVKLVMNADRRTMLREVFSLAERAEGGGEAALYFAGHGVQLNNTNYLLPTDFDGAVNAMIAHEAVSLTEISNYLLDAKVRFSLLIIDACRNNPFASKGGRNISTSRGLAPMSPATGQMVVFSAGSGQVALDSLGVKDEGRNGIFARILSKEMRQPGRDVRDVVSSVRESVETLAASVNHVQRPAVYDESKGRFEFRAAPVAADQGGVPPAAPKSKLGISEQSWKSVETIEDELWATLSAVNSAAAMEAYLREYPGGRYAPSARIRRDLLGGSVAAKATALAIPTPPVLSEAKPQAPPSVAPVAKVEQPVASDARVLTPVIPEIRVQQPLVRPAGEQPTQAARSSSGPKITTPEQLAGKRFRGRNSQFELVVVGSANELSIEQFTALRGGALRCGWTRNVIAVDAKLNLNASCNGPFYVQLRGTFPVVEATYAGEVTKIYLAE
jgi:uncharacterized caspase-like protein